VLSVPLGKYKVLFYIFLLFCYVVGSGFSFGCYNKSSSDTTQTSDPEKLINVLIDKPESHQRIGLEEKLVVQGLINNWAAIPASDRNRIHLYFFWRITTDSYWHLHEECDLKTNGHFECQPPWTPNYASRKEFELAVVATTRPIKKEYYLIQWEELPPYQGIYGVQVYK